MRILEKYLFLLRTPDGPAGEGGSPPPVADPAAGSDPKSSSLIGEPPKGAANDPKDPKADPAKEGEKTPAPAAVDAAKFTLPEGFTADETVMKSFTDILSNDKLDPQARGQELLNLYASQMKSVADGNTKAWSDMQDQWVKEVKTEYGDKLEPTRQAISKAIDTFGEKDAKAIREALDMTGAGNNPHIIKAFAKLAEVLTEGGHIKGDPPAKLGASDPNANLGEIFFPNSPEFHKKGA